MSLTFVSFSHLLWPVWVEWPYNPSSCLTPSPVSWWGNRPADLDLPAMACLSRVTMQSVLMSNAKSCIMVGESPGRSSTDRELTQFLVKYREINLRVMWWCKSQLKNDVEQRTIFRQGNHILPYFTRIIFKVLKQILAFSFICWVKIYLDFIGIKEINLLVWKMQK